MDEKWEVLKGKSGRVRYLNTETGDVTTEPPPGYRVDAKEEEEDSTGHPEQDCESDSIKSSLASKLQIALDARDNKHTSSIEEISKEGKNEPGQRETLQSKGTSLKFRAKETKIKEYPSELAFIKGDILTEVPGGDSNDHYIDATDIHDNRGFVLRSCVEELPLTKVAAQVAQSDSDTTDFSDEEAPHDDDEDLVDEYGQNEEAPHDDDEDLVDEYGQNELTEEELEEIGAVLRTIILTTEKDSGMVKTRKGYHQSMYGCEMVDWIMEHSKEDIKRQDVLGLWQVLLENEIILKTSKQNIQAFEDNKTTYQFSVDQNGKGPKIGKLEQKESKGKLQKMLILLDKPRHDAMKRVVLQKSPEDRTEEDIAVIYKLLQPIKALQFISDNVKRKLAAVAGFESYPHEGTTVYKKTDKATHWYVILRGSVKQIKDTKTVFYKGEDFGEPGDRASRDSKIILNEDNCHFLTIAKKYVDTLIKLNLSIEQFCKKYNIKPGTQEILENQGVDDIQVLMDISEDKLEKMGVVVGQCVKIGKGVKELKSIVARKLQEESDNSERKEAKTKKKSSLPIHKRQSSGEAVSSDDNLDDEEESGEESDQEQSANTKVPQGRKEVPPPRKKQTKESSDDNSDDENDEDYDDATTRNKTAVRQGRKEVPPPKNKQTKESSDDDDDDDEDDATASNKRAIKPPPPRRNKPVMEARVNEEKHGRNSGYTGKKKRAPPPVIQKQNKDYDDSSDYDEGEVLKETNTSEEESDDITERNNKPSMIKKKPPKQHSSEEDENSLNDEEDNIHKKNDVSSDDSEVERGKQEKLKAKGKAHKREKATPNQKSVGKKKQEKKEIPEKKKPKTKDKKFEDFLLRSVISFRHVKDQAHKDKNLSYRVIEGNKEDSNGFVMQKLPLLVTFSDEKNKIRKCKTGTGLDKPLHKTILLVGATGAGKSTMIDGMVNYIYGIEQEDKCRITIIDHEKGEEKGTQSVSQTDWITAYEISHSSFSQIDYSVTIVDMPGFGDTRGIERDKILIDNIKHLFSTNQEDGGLDSIDAVCFLAKSSDVRLTATQTYIFDQILSIFGEDIKDHIQVFISFADGSPPAVLNALQSAGVPFKQHFKFNNAALFPRSDDPYIPIYWQMGQIGYKSFFDFLKNVEAKSLVLSKQVLQEREKLNTIVQSLQENMFLSITKLTEQKEIKQQLEDTMQCIEENKDYEVVVMEQKQEKIKCNLNFCNTCEYNCHVDCTETSSGDLSKCFVMDIDGNCEVCPEKCKWSDHEKRAFMKKGTVIKRRVTKNDKKIEFDQAMKDKKSAEKSLKHVEKEIKKLVKEIDRSLKLVTKHMQRLDQIALKKGLPSEEDYIDLLIDQERQECKEGYQKIVERLMELKQKAKTLRNVFEEKENTILKAVKGDNI